MPRPRLHNGSSFRLTDDAIENYGEQYAGRVFIVTHVATRYAPPGGPEGTHPGYDTAAEGGGLYDFKDIRTGEDIPFSVYDWEVIYA
jgi:hypothetical protein